MTDLATMSTEMLREELARSVEITARHVSRLAAIWRELERRGEDLSSLRAGLMGYMPQIAAGELAAEAVVAFAGQATLLRALSKMTPDDQVAIARGRNIPIMLATEAGDLAQREMPAARLSAAQIRVAFGEGRLRTPREQAALLAPVKRAPRASRLQPVTVRLEPDEYRALREVASARGIRLPRLIRDALVQLGYLAARSEAEIER